MKKLVSVIVTTKNEQAVIKRLLTSVSAQSYSKIEIIVVDNRSSDKTRLIAKKFTPNVFIAGPERSAQRNFGAKKAKGDYIFFLDADMELTAKVVEMCLKSIEKSARTAMVVVPEISIANRFWERVKAFERSFYFEAGDFKIEAARFFRKEAFFEIGGYDEQITGPEDWDLPEQLKQKKYRAVRIKAPIYHYERIDSVWQLGRKKYYYGLKAHTYMQKNKVSVFGTKTIYFLRPVFYSQWKKLISHPFMSISMFVMLTIEQLYGGIGYMMGRFHK